MSDSVMGTKAAAKPLPDSYWLPRCRAGDESAVAALAAKHRLKLVRVANGILRDRAEAEDVAQEALLKGFRELKSLRDDRAFNSFLYRICVRMCTDRLRTRKNPAELTEHIKATENGNIEVKVLVERLLEQLTPDLRATLVLREMEQLSYEEVAQTMNVPVGTVRSRLHSARERFRAAWIEAHREVK